LAHEQQRRLRGAQEENRGSPIRRKIDLVVQALTQCPVAHLIVILQTDDELARRQACRIRASRRAEVLRVLPAVEPAPPQGGGKVGQRTPEVTVVPSWSPASARRT
jgi:hypothetical protein